LQDGNLLVEVEDDGVGMAAASLLERPSGVGGGSGIGIANVAERLKVLYGQTAALSLSASSAGGTLVSLRLPVLVDVLYAGIQQARATTSR
jgi:sensor histidine kinase YesM